MLLMGQCCWEYSALNVTADPRRKESLVHLQGGAKNASLLENTMKQQVDKIKPLLNMYTDLTTQAPDMLKY